LSVPIPFISPPPSSLRLLLHLTFQLEIRDFFVNNEKILPNGTNTVTLENIENIFNYNTNLSSSFRQENVTVRFVPSNKHQGYPLFSLLSVVYALSNLVSL